MERISPVTETPEMVNATRTDLARKIFVAIYGDWWGHPQTKAHERAFAAADALLAPSSGHAQTPAEAEGYVLIPREPTREMWAACGDAVVGNTSVHHDVVVRLMYRAIVAVADTSTDRAVCSRCEGKGYITKPHTDGGWYTADCPTCTDSSPVRPDGADDLEHLDGMLDDRERGR